MCAPLCVHLCVSFFVVPEYEHFGPRPLYVRLFHQDTKMETFGECVQGHMQGRGKIKGRFDCLQTAGEKWSKKERGGVGGCLSHGPF